MLKILCALIVIKFLIKVRGFYFQIKILLCPLDFIIKEKLK